MNTPALSALSSAHCCEHDCLTARAFGSSAVFMSVMQDPFISAALGPNAKLERMRAASLRLGSQGLTTSFDDHVLIIGDAAGHIDPLTGTLSCTRH